MRGQNTEGPSQIISHPPGREGRSRISPDPVKPDFFFPCSFFSLQGMDCLEMMEKKLIRVWQLKAGASLVAEWDGHR